MVLRALRAALELAGVVALLACAALSAPLWLGFAVYGWHASRRYTATPKDARGYWSHPEHPAEQEPHA